MEESGKHYITLGNTVVIIKKIGKTRMYSVSLNRDLGDLQNTVVPLEIKPLNTTLAEFGGLLDFCKNNVKNFSKDYEAKLLVMYQDIKKFNAGKINANLEIKNVKKKKMQKVSGIVYAEIKVYLKEKKPFSVNDLELLEGKIESVSGDSVSGEIFIDTANSTYMTITFTDNIITEKSVLLFTRVVSKLKDSYINLLLESYGDESKRLYDIEIVKYLDTKKR